MNCVEKRKVGEKNASNGFGFLLGNFNQETVQKGHGKKKLPKTIFFSLLDSAHSGNLKAQ